MGRRLELQTLLATLTGSRVYFQPPPKLNMQYPCIVFARDQARNKFADNIPYSHTKRYSVTIIDPDPDGEIADKIAQLPMCTFQRQFATDNLTHDIYSLYF